MAEAAVKQMDVRVLDSLQGMGYDIRGVSRGDPGAVAMFGCCPRSMTSSGMLKSDRPMDPAKDLLVVFWGMNEILKYDMRTGTSTAMPLKAPIPTTFLK